PLLLSLSTIAGTEISNPSWVNFQSAGWVSFQSAPTALGVSLETAAQETDPLVARAITYYQAASHGFKHQLLGWSNASASAK
ncbi:hypothetical protein, partial [Pseudomonas viridiflava]